MKVHVEGAEVEHYWEWAVRYPDGVRGIPCTRPEARAEAARWNGTVVRRLVVTTDWQEVDG